MIPTTQEEKTRGSPENAGERTPVRSPELDYDNLEDQDTFVAGIDNGEIDSPRFMRLQSHLFNERDSRPIPATTPFQPTVLLPPLLPSPLTAHTRSAPVVSRNRSLPQVEPPKQSSMKRAYSSIQSNYSPDTIQTFWKERLREILENPADIRGLSIPSARVRRVMKMDDSVNSRFMGTDVSHVDIW
jgi:hypothetical protein